jgi:hypothetical protein
MPLGARKEAILQVVDDNGAQVTEHRALFTTRALADAESRIGRSMTAVLMGFSTGKSGVRELALLLQAGLEAERRISSPGTEPVSYDNACDLLDQVGLTPAAEAIGSAVTAVLNYGQKQAEPEEPEKN